MPPADVSNAELPWSLTRSVAELRADGLTGSIDLPSPAEGLRNLDVQSSEIPGHVLGLAAVEPREQAPTLGDHHLRGADVIAEYLATADCPFRRQAYWRALPSSNDGVWGGVELIVSVQTSLLDSRPKLRTSSALPATEVWQLTKVDPPEMKQLPLYRKAPLQAEGEPTCFLYRLPDGKTSYAEMSLLNDVCSTELSPSQDKRWELRHDLFARFLEKGVILRSRLLGVFLDRRQDAAAAVRCYRQLSESELPLTE